MVKILATSDLHGELPEINPCDLLVIAGDICPDGLPSQQAQWLDRSFRKWLHEIPAKEVVAIAGNHDHIFEQAEALVPKGLKWHYLQDSVVELLGLRVYGTPWQLPFWGAFNLIEAKLKERYAAIPQGIDLFLSHAPPYGILDQVPLFLPEELRDEFTRSQHTGSTSLRQKIQEIKPKLFVCGHIHGSFGTCKIEETLFANVCLLDDDMEIAHAPVYFEL
jgi:Icc-related predicted phosphoesterase